MTTRGFNELIAQASEDLRLGRSADAIAAVRLAAEQAPDPVVAALNLGGVLIDAGSHLNSRPHVAEGVRLLETVADAVPPSARATYFYNLGNGYGALARFERGRGPGTRPSVSLAISNLDESLLHREFTDARTNLANSLMAQSRLVEALDEYEEVLASSTDHHQAIANRGYALSLMSRWMPAHTALLVAALHDHERAIDLAKNEPVFRASYERVAEWLRKRVKPFTPKRQSPSSYERWIWDNRLALNPCPLCRVDTPDVFDVYPLAGRLESKRRSPPLRFVLDLINRLCQGFATSRWALYSALHPSSFAGEHQVFVPSGTGAEFGLHTGLLMMACTGFYSVLNNTAFAVNSYFRLGMKPHAIKLGTIWSKNANAKSFPAKREEIRRRLLAPPNSGLTALYGLSSSLERGKGRYFPLRDLRNSIEHHIVTASSTPTEANPYCRSFTSNELAVAAVRLGRVAKAAVWYFAAAVHDDERYRARAAVRSGIPVVPGLGAPVERR